MNNQTDEKLAELLTYLLDTTKSAEGFLVEQAPMYVQELLTYSLINSYVSIGISVLLFFLMASLGLLVWKKRECIEDWPFGLVIIGIISLGPWVPIIFETMNVIKIKTAPRVFILEHVQGKLK